MVDLMFWRRQAIRGDAVEAKIKAEKIVTEAAVEGAKNAASRLQTVLDQMTQTNEERGNARRD